MAGRADGSLMLAVITATFLTSLDLTIVATATPRIVSELGGTALYAGVAAGYFLGCAVFLPIAGRAAEVFRLKRVFLGAQLVFIAGSILCGLSPSMPMLIASRVLQGVGGGSMYAVGSALVGVLFSPREQGAIMGYKSLAAAVATVGGPLVGGILCDSLSWRAVFFINPPLTLIAFFIVLARMPDIPPLAPGRFDYAGAWGLALWSAPVFLAFTWAGNQYPWTSPQVLGLFALALVALVAFLWNEARQAAPLFDLHLFRSAVFRWASVAFGFLGGCFMGTVMYLPLFLVEVKNLSATAAGTALMPIILGVSVGALLAGQVARRFGRYKEILVTASLGSMGLLWYTSQALSPAVDMGSLVALMALLGVAFGVMLVMVPLAVQNAMDASRQGTSAGAIQFFHQLGAAVWTALMGTLLVMTLHSQWSAYIPAGVLQDTEAARFTDERDLKARVQARLDGILSTLARAEQGDGTAAEALKQDPLVPDPIRQRIGAGARLDSRDGILLEDLEKRLAVDIGKAMDGLIAAGVRRIFLFAFILSMGCFLATLLLPGLELRTTALREVGDPEAAPQVTEQ